MPPLFFAALFRVLSRRSRLDSLKKAKEKKKNMNSPPTRNEAPALNHRHPFVQSRRQPHVHGASSEALDVTAAEKREHAGHHHDVEHATSGVPSPPASVAVSPAPGDPAHPSNDEESHEDVDEVRFWVGTSRRVERGRESEAKKCQPFHDASDFEPSL